MHENLKTIYAKTNSLSEKLKELINTLQNKIKSDDKKKKNLTKKLNKINEETKSQNALKNSITEDMKNLENIITTKINKITEFRRLKKGKKSVERSKKELFFYKSSEDLINIKQKQLKNISKLNTILDKDISKINFNLKRGYYINQGIQEKNPEIKTKVDELNYTYNKIDVDISNIKNEIQILKNIKDVHNKCDGKIIKLKKELENLKERKNRNINYSELVIKNKEMNEIKRKQIIANKVLENTKFRFLLDDNKRYKNTRANSLIKTTKNISNNKLFFNNDKGINNRNKHNNESILSAEVNNISYNNEDLENKFKNLLQSKIEERNNQKRKFDSIIKELDQENNKKEAELKEKETKKKNLLKTNYSLLNSQKLNEAKIKKFKKQINELIKEENNYDKLIAQKEEAMQELKNIVDLVNSMQQLRV